MPNGISCAYFAYKNHQVAKDDDNVFRGGIAAIQGVRTIDAVASSVSALPVASVLALSGNKNRVLPPASTTVGSSMHPFFKKLCNGISSLARGGRQLVYPLIVASGILNTVRAEDKVKTGFSQAAGIGSMYLMENATERILDVITSNIEKRPNVRPALKAAWSVARGLMYVAASLGGYEIGNKIVSSKIDEIRTNKQKKISKKFQELNNNAVNTDEKNVFSSMNLQTKAT